MNGDTMKSGMNLAITRKAITHRIGCFRDTLNQLWKSCRFAVKPTLILWLVFVVGINAIILANFNYIDDMGRVAQGYKRWDNFSRYTSNFLSSFMHVGNYLTDISPLTQLVASLELSLASVIAVYVISGRRSLNVWIIAAVLPLGLCPYFLECLSYKFDSPYMALSILASIAPLLLAQRRKLAYGLAVILGELVVCTTYQAASGILPLLVIVLALRHWCAGHPGKQVLAFLLVSAGSYLIALIIFRLFIMQPISTYVSNGLPPLDELPGVYFEHLKRYFKYVLTDFKKPWLILIGLTILAFVWVTIRDTQRNRIATLVLALGSLLAMSCLAFGIYPALEQPLYSPRAMYGVGAFISFLAIIVASSQHIVIGKLVILALSWCFFVFSFTYGNALYVQAQWTDFRITSVIEDLDNLPEFTTDTPKVVQIKGSIGKSPILRKQPQNYQMLNRLVPVTFQGSWSWGIAGIAYYYGIPHAKFEAKTTFDESLPLLQEGMYHTIYGDGENFLVVLK